MEYPLVTEYDMVVNYLKEQVKFADTAERQQSMVDLVGLLELATRWIREFDLNPGRRGDPFNLALLQWSVETMDNNARKVRLIFRACNLPEGGV